MGLRYVWSKWNAVYNYKYRKVTSEPDKGYDAMVSGYDITPRNNLYTELYFNEDTGEYSMGGELDWVNDGQYCQYKGYYHAAYHTGAASDAELLFRLTTKYTSERYINSVTKGNTSYGNVSAGSYGAYPENSYNGNYWYVPLSPDSIDPTALTYSDTVKAGGTINLTITPSSDIVHGGNITYVVQTTTNGEDWYDAGTTTGTTFAVTVPEDAAIWNVRVYAKDDTGFTSSTYVYGNNIDTWVTVIQSEIVPVSGDMGYLTSKNLVAVAVTHVSEQTYSISASINGIPCFSKSDVPIADATYITLEDETWNELPEETEQTLEVTISFTGSTENRTYTFRKFTYDETSLEGVMEGIARALRIKREYETQIPGRNMPKEIIKIDNPVNTSGLQKATAGELQVFDGYTFFAGDTDMRTGQAMAQATNVTAANMFTGTKAYNKQGKLITGAPTKTNVQASDIARGKKAYTDAGALLTGTGLTVLAGSIQPPIEYRTYTISYPSGVSGKPRAILAYINVWIGSYATPGQQPSFSPYFFRGAVSGQLNGITTAVSGTMRNQNQSSANTTIDVYTDHFAVTFNKYDYVAGNEFCYICIW